MKASIRNYKRVRRGLPSKKSKLRYASTHWQCKCMNAGWRSRICDLCGTPFVWEPSRDDWVAMGPLPGETWEEHMAEYDKMKAEGGDA